MKFYNIIYVERSVAYISIEAENEKEAYERFDALLNCSDVVYDNLDYSSSDYDIEYESDKPDSCSDYVLTDKEYTEHYK